jgi:hypothetical protein
VTNTWGLSNPGVVVITAWEQELWWEDTDRTWVDEARPIPELLEVEIVPRDEAGRRYELRWTEPQARAFMLLEVLVQELGHHHERMTTRGTDAPRGEPYAIQYARRVQDDVWPEYVHVFGI